ncbi:hypothetical protein EU642_21795 [Salmonella enterica]|nr:hypothetical protein [Salmonella enterica]EAO0118487.1 hypothetical protein [Salmonella enterica]EAO3601707.1 hypothetical protein [Salmonella enterica]EAR6391604.1 hypothetical protein [Salmonella enterica]EAV1285249.1 hypothetical protein [Salmonella enterica]
MTVTNTSKRERRTERRIAAFVQRMGSSMTCLVAMWPDLSPTRRSDLDMSWRRLKKRLSSRLDHRIWTLKRDAVTHSYMQALNMAASEDERATIHAMALDMYPDFYWLIVDLHRQFNAA